MPDEDVEKGLNVVSISMRNPEKHFDRHELHRTGPVPSPAGTLAFLGQVQVDEHALKARLSFPFPDR